MGREPQAPRGGKIARAALTFAAPVALLAVGSAVAMGACTGPGNTGQSTIDPTLEMEVPWVNGGSPVLDGGHPVIPTTPVYPPIASGLPDPGSGPVDCSVLNGVETSPDFYDTFEASSDGTTPANTVGVATAWTGYDDLSWGSFHAPGDITWYPPADPNNPPATPCIGPRCDPGTYVWGLAAYPMGGPSCDNKPNNWSLHFRGGLFRNWGGGVSSVFTDPRGSCKPDSGLCPPTPAPGATLDSAGLPLQPPDAGPDAMPDQAYTQQHAFLDASAYDGVAFWARTGPEGQTAMIVTITDSFTSDRLARRNQKFCRRLRQCYTQCLNGSPCSPNMEPGADGGITSVYRCFDSAQGIAQGTLGMNVNGNDIPALTDLLYKRCGPSACTSPNTYLDPDFDGKQCRPYTFPAADYSAEYCWNPDDPPPPDRDEQCLDGWAAAVDLTLDWQYFTIPWSKMHQGGFGKQAPYFNTKAIDVIAFGFIDGWADVYVDNVSFYRSTL
jgi:hypothetical protein